MIAELTNIAATRPAPDLRRLNLTGAHLREGIPGDDNLCAVAIGLLDTLGLPEGLARVTVTESVIDLHTGPNVCWWARVPEEMKEFIDDFDQTEDDPEMLKRMMLSANLGLYQYDLTWHPGSWQPPEDDG